MQFSKITKVAILPAAAVGIALSAWAVTGAGAGHAGEAAAATHPVSHAAHGQGSQHGAAADAKAATAMTAEAQLKARNAAQQAGARRAAARRAQAHPNAAPVPHNTGSGGASGAAGTASGGSITAGMSTFERCVAWRESGDTPTDPAGLFGILPSTWASLGYSGTAGQAPVAVQKQAFNKLYAQYGTSPWAPYDGC